jgi:hypothetical protein
VCFLNQVVLLQEEKANLLSEIDRLNERLNQADSLDDPGFVKSFVICVCVSASNAKIN